jgi:hypothetical protein
VNRRLHAVPDSLAEDLAAQDASLDVDCPRCGASRDAYCHNTELGNPLRASHWQRTRRAADLAAEPRT